MTKNDDKTVVTRDDKGHVTDVHKQDDKGWERTGPGKTGGKGGGSSDKGGKK